MTRSLAPFVGSHQMHQAPTEICSSGIITPWPFISTATLTPPNPVGCGAGDICCSVLVSDVIGSAPHSPLLSGLRLSIWQQLQCQRLGCQTIPFSFSLQLCGSVIIPILLKGKLGFGLAKWRAPNHTARVHPGSVWPEHKPPASCLRALIILLSYRLDKEWKAVHPNTRSSATLTLFILLIIEWFSWKQSHFGFKTLWGRKEGSLGFVFTSGHIGCLCEHIQLHFQKHPVNIFPENTHFPPPVCHIFILSPLPRVHEAPFHSHSRLSVLLSQATFIWTAKTFLAF